jgi:hypothetical protein
MVERSEDISGGTEASIAKGEIPGMVDFTGDCRGSFAKSGLPGDADDLGFFGISEVFFRVSEIFGWSNGPNMRHGGIPADGIGIARPPPF